eukprot:scaffold110438_cov52-Attheya_sp.AAC.4
MHMFIDEHPLSLHPLTLGAVLSELENVPGQKSVQQSQKASFWSCPGTLFPCPPAKCPGIYVQTYATQ